MKKLFSESIFGPLLTFFLVLLFFIPHLLLGKVPIPADSLLGLYHPFRDISFEGYTQGRFPTKNPLITDPVLQTYPWRMLTIENLRDGNLPLWNPYSFSGQPLLANIQSAPFQIFNLLFFTLPFKIAWTLSIILPPILLSFFMFLLLRDFKLSREAAIFGSFILPFTGFFVAWQTWGTVITTAMWLPLILLSIRKLFEKTNLVYFLVLILSASQTILSGHAQTALYVFSASFFYLLLRVLRAKYYKPLTLVLGSIFLAFLISTPQILPALEFSLLSTRQVDQGYSPGRADWFLPPQNLIQLVAPDFFGNPATYNYWGIWNYAEFTSFIGIIPLSLALLSLIDLLKKRSETIFFVLLASVSLLFALPNPISKLPYVLNLPMIASMQPSRIIFLLVFATVTLSAFGFEIFFQKISFKKLLRPSLLILVILSILLISTRIQKDLYLTVGVTNASYVAFRNLLFPIIITLLLLAIVFLRILSVSKPFILIAIFAFTFVDLFRFYQKFTPFSKLSWIFPETQITRYLAEQEKPFRILSQDRRIMHPNISAVYGIESTDGYDPLFLRDYANLVTAWQGGEAVSPGSFNRIVTPQKYDSSITNLLNVKYILTFDELSGAGFKKILEEGETKVYQNENVLPRAFFVNGVVKVANGKQELEKLLDKNINLKTQAVASSFEFPNQSFSAKVTLEKYTDQSLEMTTVSDNDAPLILSNIFYPGWKAFIDGRETEIKRANFMLQALIVPKGKHVIEFKFRPKVFYNGLYLSIIGVILTAISAFLLWNKKYR